MKTIFLIIFGIISIICLLIYGIDFCFFLYNRYSRFHIGRLETEQWNEAVKKKAIRWLKRTPVVKITDSNRYVLIDMLMGRYKSLTIQSWQIASLLLGIYEGNIDEEFNPIRKVRERLLHPQGHWVIKPVAVDAGMLSYALLKSADDKTKVKAAMDETLIVVKRQINKMGLISYTGGPDNPEMYVDTLGLTCPFLFQYSKVYQKPELESLAFTQIEFYHEHGLYPGTVLPNHAVNCITKLPSGVFGWGRGTGWYLLSLIDSIPYAQDKRIRQTLIQWAEEAAEEYKKFQRIDGGFGTTIQRMQTYDSSSTSVFAWFYMRCYELFDKEEYLMIAEKCLAKLRKMTRLTGSIDYCQGDTKDIGVFSQTYDIMPFAQGMTLRTIYLWKKVSSDE